MKTRLTLKPGQEGTKRLTEKYGEALVIKIQKEVNRMTTDRLLTLITVVFTLLLPLSADASPLFTLADLTGRWEMNRLGSPGPWWARGLYEILGGGTFINALIHGSNNSSTLESGAFAIADDGIITEPGSDFTSSFKCAMDSGKRIAACTNTTATGEADLHLFSRKASG